ncbi:MAG: YraN family protein [Alphaproteobacteria bacterium]|nr:YraN family protein [Alphaproteobacteria bacterium]
MTGRQRPAAERALSERRGRWAEAWVGVLLSYRGYRVIARRYRSPYGEVDLIASGHGQLRFVEVKFRRNYSPDQLDQILPTPAARQRIHRTALHYLAHNPHNDDITLHIDVVIINRFGRAEWFRDAWF